jgi:AraC family transcriptional regulator
LAWDVTLDDIALGSGVSACHLTRAFAAATGRSAMRYLRGRRLSEAARTLARGAPDILAVALDAGYSSHEAFTRAFREQFGVTPECIRARRCLDDIELVEPIRMADAPIADLGPPRIEATSKPLLIAGLGQRHTNASNAIPAQWQRFHPYIGNLHGQVGELAYGIIRKGDAAASVDYICGIEVCDFSEIPEEFVRFGFLRRGMRCFSTAITSPLFAAPSPPSGTRGFPSWATARPTGSALSVMATPSTRAPAWAVSRSGYRSGQG